MSEPCPECGKIIETCKCGEWDCAFYAHLRKECQSERGIEYAKQVEEYIRRRRDDDE